MYDSVYPFFVISIHAPREGSDIRPTVKSMSCATFLSTLPARGATLTMGSIRWTSTNFYPRSPRGERLLEGLCPVCIKQFLSTLPARGAT